MKAWVFQDDKQVKAKGPDKASWYVGFIDPDGKRRCKSCGPGARGKNGAEKLARKTEGELLAGTYQSKGRQSWEDFRTQYETKSLTAMEHRSREAAVQALDRFQETMKPKKVSAITSATIDDYVARRSQADGYEGRKLSKATINKQLRYLRAMLRVAHDWGFIPKVPRFKFLKVPQKLPTFLSPEDFAKLYQACDHAKYPAALPNVSAGDWWRGLLMTAYLTGWRIGALLALKWADVDLETGTALSHAEDNKGKRDALVPLHSVVVDHLRKLMGSFDDTVFPWDYNQRTLWVQFHRLQESAKVKPATKKRYGFQDLRRGFATMNAAGMDLFTLQKLMQHKSLETTKLYVNMVDRLKPAVAAIFVPDVGRGSRVEGNMREAVAASS
jgi:integrase